MNSVTAGFFTQKSRFNFVLKHFIKMAVCGDLRQSLYFDKSICENFREVFKRT